MKKSLLAGLILSSVTVLGACSNENEADGKQKPDVIEQEITQEIETETLTKVVFKLEGEEQELPLVPRDISSKLAQEVYVPQKNFRVSGNEEDIFQAVGEAEYEDISLAISQEKLIQGKDALIQHLRKLATEPYGGVPDEPSEATPVDLEEYPALKAQYDYVIKSQRSSGLAYYAFKILNEEESIKVHLVIRTEEQEKYEELGLELMRKVKTPEPPA